MAKKKNNTLVESVESVAAQLSLLKRFKEDLQEIIRQEHPSVFTNSDTDTGDIFKFFGEEVRKKSVAQARKDLEVLEEILRKLRRHQRSIIDEVVGQRIVVPSLTYY